MRFYERQRPNSEEFVIGQVTQVDELGVRVILLEYDDLEGYVAPFNMRRKGVRSAKQLGKVGTITCFQVIYVDEKSIDLSRVSVEPGDREAKNTQFEMAKRVRDVLRYVAREHEVVDIQQQLCWPNIDTLTDLVNGIGREAVSVLTPEIWIAIEREGRKKLNLDKPVEVVETYVDVLCTGPRGILGVQEALRAGLAVDPRVAITLKQSPLYMIRCVGGDLPEPHDDPSSTLDRQAVTNEGAAQAFQDKELFVDDAGHSPRTAEERTTAQSGLSSSGGNAVLYRVVAAIKETIEKLEGGKLKWHRRELPVKDEYDQLYRQTSIEVVFK